MTPTGAGQDGAHIVRCTDFGGALGDHGGPGPMRVSLFNMVLPHTHTHTYTHPPTHTPKHSVPAVRASGGLHDTYKANSRHATLSSHHIMAPLRDSPQSIPGVGNIHTLCTRTWCYPYHIVHTDPVCSPQWVNVSHSPQFAGLGICTTSTTSANQTLFHLADIVIVLCTM